MATITLLTIKHWASRAVIFFATSIVVVGIVVAWLLNDRPRLDAIDWPPVPTESVAADSVTATWLGVTTLLFDDGETQLLIDGFFSRPSLADIVFNVPVESDAATINTVMDVYEMRRLAAIIPVHSHFDHALDVGAIANRSNASILGSESTAQIARGAGVPEDQIIVVSFGESYAFGEFTVRIIESVHAPIGWGGTVPLGGVVNEPLETPAPITAWREGGSFSILVAHPQGTTLVQGSAGYVERAMRNVRADVVMLGTSGLVGLGNDYTRKYWQTYVTATGALRVIPVHFDDFTLSFGDIRPFPRIIDDFAETARLLENIRQIWDTDTRIYLPEFGKPIVLYPRATPEA
jgi:L-ascorbate metabolism protein UlaG (beta-lactamase superfamily)